MKHIHPGVVSLWSNVCVKTRGLTDPVLLWLQGGPGGSSFFGALVENGPFGIDKDLHSEKNKLCHFVCFLPIYCMHIVARFALIDSLIERHLYSRSFVFFTVLLPISVITDVITNILLPSPLLKLSVCLCVCVCLSDGPP